MATTGISDVSAFHTISRAFSGCVLSSSARTATIKPTSDCKARRFPGAPGHKQHLTVPRPHIRDH